jgi:hypothetical protein
MSSPVRVTLLQYRVYVWAREGLSQSQMAARHTGRKDTVNGHVRALQRKGVLSRGRAGVRGSVRPLVRPAALLLPGEAPLPAAWRTDAVARMARAADADLGSAPVLADALEEAGCDDQALLDALRKLADVPAVRRVIERLR